MDIADYTYPITKVSKLFHCHLLLNVVRCRMRIRHVVRSGKCAIKTSFSLIRKAAIWASMLYNANCILSAECLSQTSLGNCEGWKKGDECGRKTEHQPQNWQKQQENVFRRRRDAVSLMFLRLIALTKSHWRSKTQRKIVINHFNKIFKNDHE